MTELIAQALRCTEQQRAAAHRVLCISIDSLGLSADVELAVRDAVYRRLFPEHANDLAVFIGADLIAEVALGGKMRERIDNAHERVWADRLQTSWPKHIEQQAELAADRIRDAEPSLADLRAEWAEFANANQSSTTTVQQDFVLAQNLAYARAVDGMLRDETGEGLRGNDVTDVFDDYLAGLSKPAATVPTAYASAPLRLDSEDRAAVQAAAIELIARPHFQSSPIQVSPTPDASPRAQGHIHLKDLPPIAPARPLPENSIERTVDHATSMPQVRRFAVRATNPANSAVSTLDDRPALSSRDPAPKLNGLFSIRSADTNPGCKNVPSPGPKRSSSRAQPLELLREEFERDDDVDLAARLSERYRVQAFAHERRMASVAVDADREHLQLTMAAKHDPEAAREVAAVDVEIARIKRTLGRHSPTDLAAKIETLHEREQDPDVTAGRFRIERLAYGVLAREAYERQNSLIQKTQEEYMNSVLALPEKDHAAMMVTAAKYLREPAYNDHAAMSRELLRDEDQQLSRIVAVARAAPSFHQLYREASDQPASFDNRVDAEVLARVHRPELDGQLEGALAHARVRAAAAHALSDRVAAFESALELAEIRRRLPLARAEEATPHSGFRAAAVAPRRSP